MSGATARPLPRDVTLALAALLVLTASVYLPVVRFGFMPIDDTLYVAENAHVQAGLTIPTVLWAFRSIEGANWHPLTWLSHALDVQMFGPWVGGYHAMNLALHLLAVVLVFLALRALTGAAWRSLAVAALFALHPMNVESVVWISERKNTLSAVFYASTLLAYAGYARRPTALRYAGVTTLYALGLMAKPMLVTLPFVLLLLDVWPLGRCPARSRGRVVAEKLPWLALSAASAAITMLAQSRGDAVVTWQELGLAPRLCVATAGYADYVRLLLYPARLIVYFSSPRDPCRELPVGAAASVLLLASFLVVWFARNRVAAAVGWAWFLGMLVPVCGLVQVGGQLIADRYVYHPILGFGVALLFGVADRIPVRWAHASAVAFACVCAAWAWRSRVEVGYWEDNERLFARVIEITGADCGAEAQIGMIRSRRGDIPGAIEHLRRATEQCWDQAPAHARLGALLARQGEFDAAIPHFVAVAQLAPANAADMRYNIGLAHWLKGRSADAVRELRAAVALDPKNKAAQALLDRVEAGEKGTAR